MFKLLFGTKEAVDNLNSLIAEFLANPEADVSAEHVMEMLKLERGDESLAEVIAHFLNRRGRPLVLGRNMEGYKVGTVDEMRKDYLIPNVQSYFDPGRQLYEAKKEYEQKKGWYFETEEGRDTLGSIMEKE